MGPGGRTAGAPAGQVSARVQLRALVGLRLTMVRAARTRAGFLLLLLAVPLSLLGAASAGRLLDEETAFDISLLGPTVFLGFAALSLLSPLSAAGGQNLYPLEQLVALPVRPGTQFLSGLAVLPLNLAWLLQLLAVAATAFLLLPPSRFTLPAVVVVALFVAAVSVVGQLLTWTAVGLRRQRSGRLTVWAVTAAVAVGAVLAVQLAGTTRLLDSSPTTSAFVAVLQFGTGAPDRRAWATVAVLLAVSLAGFAAGRRACDWALRRPGDAATFGESRPLPRSRDERVSLRSVDRRSIWRSSSLRRGVLVLGLLPGAMAAVLGVDWTTMVLLPGLVAAGAGLLFGVNAFCLDGTGALWLASLPHDPGLAIRAKTRVLAETCLGCVGLAVVAAAVRVDRPPGAAELSALACAVVVTTTCVVGTCLGYSTTRPHQAELRGPRDTPAPPGAMAVYSLRLAVGTTLLGLVLSASARLGVWWLPWLVALPALLLALRRVARSWARWADPDTRAGILVRVSSG